MLRRIDWSAHPLGPPDSWPQCLRLPVGICLNNRFPMSVWWGPEWALIYNDSYAPILGKRHPDAMGRSARVVWSDVWPAIAHQLEAVRRGESTWSERVLLPTDRNGSMEDAWFTWSFCPIRSETGRVEGSFVVAVEETAHVLRERELTETRDRLELTLSAAEIGHWTFDPATGRVMVDASLAQTFSIAPKEAAGAPLQMFIDAIHPDDRAKTVAALEEAMAKGSLYETVYRLTSQTGPARWVMARGRVARDGNGKALSISGVTIDITTRVQSEQLVAVQNDILRLVASDTSLPRILKALVRHVEAVSEGAIASILLVDDRGRLRHGAAPSLPDDFNRAVDGMQIGENVGVCGRAAFLGEIVVSPDIAADPNWACFKDRTDALGLRAAWSAPILSAGGKVLGTFGTYFRRKRGPTAAERAAVDFLTKTAGLAIERARAKEELRLREERFRQIADTLPQIVWGAGPDGVLDYYNRRWFEYIGLSESDAEHARWESYVHPEDLPAAVATWHAALETGKVYQMEFRVRNAAGFYRWFLTRALPIRNSEDGIVRWFGTCTDIDDRKGVQEENLRMIERERTARVASEDAGRLKDDFLATLSHELRTPLNPVLLLASEGAADTSLPAEVRADFEAIAKNVSLEARLIDDLLDLTRITRGKMALSIASADIHPVIKDALGNVAAEIEEKKIEVVTDFAAAQPVVAGDVVRLQQVFWNILRNAAKFTPKGGSIAVSTGMTADRQRVEVRVTDSGMGMNEEEVGRLFNAFVQGDHAGGTGSHRFGGLGLGLAISRMLVELHSGRISGYSAGPGLGSTFSVEIPVADRLETGPSAGGSSLSKKPANSSTAGRRILLVDDHEPTRTSIKHLLIRRRYEVVEAGSVGEALAIAKTVKFDLLVTDIGLPDGDGHHLMRTLRGSHGIAGIALTGYGMKEDIERSRLAGFASHLTKPIRVQELDAALASAEIEVSHTEQSRPAAGFR